MKLFSLFYKPSPTVRAFTLVEALVATGIITVVMLGPLTVAINSATYARQTRDVMVATYLAQEALELLHHQQDSIYIACLSQHTTSICPGSQQETLAETAWRLFEERLQQNVEGASCFFGENPHGCAYDFIDMSGGAETNPSKYDASRPECKTLALNTFTEDDGTPMRYMYVCSGVVSHITGTTTPTSFSRSVSVLSIPTYAEGGTIYNDDLRVTASVTFTRPNGFTRTITVIDFFHMKA